MNVISAALRDINERLSLPQPQKSRILLEIADDMQAMRDFYVERGMDEREAAEKAVKKFDVSSDALSELVDLHDTPFRRLLGTISMQARTWWERAALVLLILFVAVVSGRQVLTSRLLSDAGSFVWAVAVFTASAMVLSSWHAYRLFLKKEHDPRRVRTGLPALVLLGSGSLLSGLLGSAMADYSALGSGALDRTVMARGLMEAAIGSSALMMASLVSVIIVFLLWFMLMDKAWKIERAEVEWLLRIE